MESSDPPEESEGRAAFQVRYRRLILLVSVLIVGACGLIYELALGAVASYLIGDSVTQYSLVIGAFLASMGVGSWLTQWIKTELLSAFLLIQLAVGVIGGYSALAVFFAFAYLDEVTVVVVLWTAAVGVLVGMEIPLILRLLRQGSSLRTAVSHVLSADYIGALGASVAFPFLVLPLLGLARAALVFGMFNTLIATLGTALFWTDLPRRRRLTICNILAWSLLGLGAYFANDTTTWIEDRLYQDEIIWAETTRYQRIVITRWRDDYRLHLNGHLQFSSADEYRYHEALVLPAIQAARQLDRQRGSSTLRVLILGGGDGLAARHVLDAGGIAHVDLVDIDRRVVELFRDHQHLRRLNDNALSDGRVTCHFEDAMTFLRQAKSSTYDVIIMDLPDPSTVATNKLYTDTFFGLALRRLSDRGVVVTQASSPFYARRAFWCIFHTFEHALKKLPRSSQTSQTSQSLTPYHVYVPSFGEWGFVMVTPESPESPVAMRAEAPSRRFMTPQTFAHARQFPPDVAAVPTEINRLDQPVLVRYHLADWSRWGE